MFFSSDIADFKAERLSRVLGIPRSKKVGRYLGHHVAVNGKNMERHMDLMRKCKEESKVGN